MLTTRAVNTGQKLPALYLTCGLSITFTRNNRRLRRQLDFLHIPYVYEEWAGAMRDFWDPERPAVPAVYPGMTRPGGGSPACERM